MVLLKSVKLNHVSGRYEIEFCDECNNVTFTGISLRDMKDMIKLLVEAL